MAELTYTLGEHPQIKELLSVLEQNNLQKQKEEVQALVGYMDSLEGKLAQMMEEMKEMRLDLKFEGETEGLKMRPRWDSLFFSFLFFLSIFIISGF